MVKLESYGKLTEKADNVLKKGYIFNKFVAFTLRSKADKGFNFTNKIELNKEKDTGAAVNQTTTTAVEYKGQDFGVTGTFAASDSSVKIAGDYKFPERQDVQFKGNLTLTPTKANGTEDTKTLRKGEISAEYTHEQAKVKVAVTSDPLIKLQAVTGKEKVGFGISTELDIASKRLSVYDAALWWFDATNRFVLSHNSSDKTSYKLGTLAFSAFHSLGETTQIAAALNYNHGQEKDNIEVKLGMEKAISQRSDLKLRLGSDGQFAMGLRNKLCPNVFLQTCANINAKKVASGGFDSYQFGWKIKIEG